MTPWPLLLAALALGTASIPHCALMCAAPCAALSQGGGRAALGFQAARLAGYMAAGAVAAGSVAALGEWRQAAPALQPLWTLLHLGFLALGLHWLATGQQPALLRRDATLPIVVVQRHESTKGRSRVDSTPSGRGGGPLPPPGGGHQRPLRAVAAGLGWIAWPCATLQGALLLAALADGAAAGALVMAAFGLASLPGLVAAPWLWSRWRAAHGAALSPERATRLGYRVAGAGLVLASGWALAHGLVDRVLAWCGG